MNNIIDVYGIYADLVIPGTTACIHVQDEEFINTIKLAIEEGERKICIVYSRESQVEDKIVAEVSKLGTYCVIRTVLYQYENNLLINVYGIDRCEVIKTSCIEKTMEMSIKIDDKEFAYIGGEQEFDDKKEKVNAMLFERSIILIENYGYYREFSNALSVFFQDFTIYSLRDLILKFILLLGNLNELKYKFLESNTWTERCDIVEKHFINILPTDEEIQQHMDESISTDILLAAGMCSLNQEQEDANTSEESLTDNKNNDLEINKQASENTWQKRQNKDKKDNDSELVEEYEKKLEELNLSEDIKEKLRKEIDILKSGERTGSIKNYLELVFSIPFNKFTEDRNDFKEIKYILNQDQYGLTGVKERILDYLAVKNLNPDSKGTIICLAGPPGTGKTSIAKSIAKALGKKYVHISLGGAVGVSEARGLDRGYRNPSAGRFIEALINAKSMNPLILLDEIDKVSEDSYNGNLAAALLEVLDPGQNQTFRDNYVEIPVDLSKVLFIATANDLSTISRPLLDRMEVIEISSYIEDEKFHIAKDYLLKEELREAGLDEENISITDDAIKKIIHNYTREPGVRNLKRKMETICRKIARNKLEKGITKNAIEADDLEKRQEWVL